MTDTPRPLIVGTHRKRESGNVAMDADDPRWNAQCPTCSAEPPTHHHWCPQSPESTLTASHSPAIPSKARIPQHAILAGDSATRVLLAVLSGASTYEQLVKVTGKNRATIHEHLVRLRGEGLVDWDSGRWGTLRSAVTVVAMTPEVRCG